MNAEAPHGAWVENGATVAPAVGGPCVALERGDLAQIRSHTLTCMGRLALAHTDEVALVLRWAGDGQALGTHRCSSFLPPPGPSETACVVLLCFRLAPTYLQRTWWGQTSTSPVELVEPQEGIGGSCSDLQPEAGSGNVESRRDILSTEPDSSFCIQLTKTGVRPNSAYPLAKAAPDPEA